MKFLKQSLFFVIMMVIMTGVGFGKESPPKKAPFELSVTKDFSSKVLHVTPQMDVIAIDESETYQIQKCESKAIVYRSVEQLAEVLFVLSKFKTYGNDPNSQIKKVEHRCRSSDLHIG